MLKDLKLPLTIKGTVGIDRIDRGIDKNKVIACKIVDRLYGKIRVCLENDKEISAFWKSIMLGSLPRTQENTREYITNNMSKEEVRKLLVDIMKDLSEME